MSEGIWMWPLGGVLLLLGVWVWLAPLAAPPAPDDPAPPGPVAGDGAGSTAAIRSELRHLLERAIPNGDGTGASIGVGGGLPDDLWLVWLRRDDQGREHHLVARVTPTAADASSASFSAIDHAGERCGSAIGVGFEGGLLRLRDQPLELSVQFADELRRCARPGLALLAAWPVDALTIGSALTVAGESWRVVAADAERLWALPVAALPVAAAVPERLLALRRGADGRLAAIELSTVTDAGSAALCLRRGTSTGSAAAPSSP